MTRPFSELELGSLDVCVKPLNVMALAQGYVLKTDLLKDELHKRYANSQVDDVKTDRP